MLAAVIAVPEIMVALDAVDIVLEPKSEFEVNKRITPVVVAAIPMPNVVQPTVLNALYLPHSGVFL